MVRNWRIVLVSLSAATVLAFLATLFHHSRVQAQLGERATAVLLGVAGIDEGATAVAENGRDIVLEGRVSSRAAEARAIEAVAGVAGVRNVVSRVVVRGGDEVRGSTSDDEEGREPVQEAQEAEP